MSIIDFIKEMPWWYRDILIPMFCLYYVIREILDRKIRLSNDAKKNAREIAGEIAKKYAK